MKPILVTGANRSGTTWVGKMLSCSERLLQVWEPFNSLMPPESKIAGANPFSRQYHYVLPAQTPAVENYLNRRIISAAYVTGEPNQSNLRFLGKIFGTLNNLLDLKLNTKQILFKDPIALLSAEWLAHKYNARVVILIRHPAAYVNSIKRVDWDMSLDELCAQSEFLATLPASLVAEIRDRVNSKSTGDGYNLEDAALSWKVFHQVIYQYQQAHPDWIFVKHEDLCRDFVGGFKDLYSRLALPWSIEVQEKIEQYCDRSKQPELGSQIHILNRNSRLTSQVWKQSLTLQEINRIKEITQNVADLFYGSDSWK